MKEPRRLSDMPLAAQAALLGQGAAFWRFLTEETAYEAVDARDAAEAIREFCGVISRRDIRPGTEAAEKFRELKAQFQAWMRVGA